MLKSPDLPCLSLTVLYDGGCPLCRREIHHYRTLKARVPVVWVDIVSTAELPYAVDRMAALAEFHVVDDRGQLHRGADGFLLLWSVLPGYRHWARCCRLMHLEPLMRFVYRHFASWHFRRRCNDPGCDLEKERDKG